MQRPSQEGRCVRRARTHASKNNYERAILNNIGVQVEPDVIQSAQSIKDPLLVPKGPIMRARAKKIKEVMQGFVQVTLDEFNSNSICKRPIFKMDLKEEEPALVYLI
ncbi:hypothetical protein WN943_023004 [Citrus x changshan-huyou]